MMGPAKRRRLHYVTLHPVRKTPVVIKGSVLRPSTATGVTVLKVFMESSVNTSCEFSCEEGYILTGSNYSLLMCDASGQWNDSQPTYEAVRCPALEEPVDGRMIFSVQCPVLQTPQNGSMSCTDQNLFKGSICSFACSEGFNLEGASSTECTEIGEWSTNIPSCT
ncbi:hypothetical protein QTP70_014590, partial [Hemibagrus guttatus]